MPTPDLAALRQRLTLTGGRRPLLGGLAALPLTGAGALLPLPDDDAAAKRKGANAEKKKKKKKLTLCLNGQTISASKKKAKKLRKQGATSGKCRATTTTPAPCLPSDVRFRVNTGSEGSALGQLDSPLGVTLSRDTRTLWVADSTNNRISIWTRPNAASTVWSNPASFGTSGTGDAELQNPVDVAISRDELTAWVVDSNNNRISVWTRADTATTTWSHASNFGTPGNGNGQLNSPSGVSIAPDTLTLWVTDTLNSRVTVWTRPNTGATFTQATEFGNGVVSIALGIITSADTLTAWVADPFNQRITIWTRPDTSSLVWTNVKNFGNVGSGLELLGFAARLAMDASEKVLWLNDQTSDRVTVWTRPNTSSLTWTPLAAIGGKGSGPGQFDTPIGLAISRDGATLMVADTNNNRLSMWTRTC
ncbi:MAG: hypothetical protein QM692_20985 [Thermomicrobiales bacterium]